MTDSGICSGDILWILPPEGHALVKVASKKSRKETDAAAPVAPVVQNQVGFSATPSHHARCSDADGGSRCFETGKEKSTKIGIYGRSASVACCLCRVWTGTDPAGLVSLATMDIHKRCMFDVRKRRLLRRRTQISWPTASGKRRSFPTHPAAQVPPSLMNLKGLQEQLWAEDPSTTVVRFVCMSMGATIVICTFVQMEGHEGQLSTHFVGSTNIAISSWFHTSSQQGETKHEWKE